MRRSIAFLIFLFFAVFALFAVPSGDTKPDPYGTAEFPQWQKDLRRAEIIAFGTLPFVTFLSSVGFEVYRYQAHGYADAYKPWPIKDSNTAIALSEGEQVKILMISAGISIGSAVFDYGFRAIMRALRANALDRHNREIPDPIQIMPVQADQEHESTED